jgi:hypothetical protein
MIYQKYGPRSEPSPTVNFTFVVLMVMTGLTIVLAIPYFLLKKKQPKGAKPEASSPRACLPCPPALPACLARLPPVGAPTCPCDTRNDPLTKSFAAAAGD